MAIGNNIKNFRMKKGMTQKDLAEHLNVTFQAVSRWENDSVEPSIDMLKSLTEVLECSLDDLFGNQTVPPKPEVVEKVVYEDYKPVLGVCENCNKPIFVSNDICRFSTFDSVRQGRVHKSVENKHLFCKECNNKRLEEEKRKKELKIKNYKKDLKKKRILSFIIGGIVALIFILISVLMFVNKDTESGIFYIGVALMGFAFASCIVLKNTFLTDMWLEIASWGFVKMPGIIFSLSFDGIIFLILAKILFFILGIILALLSVIFATVLALVLSIFAYPFALAKNIIGKVPENI